MVRIGKYISHYMLDDNLRDKCENICYLRLKFDFDKIRKIFSTTNKLNNVVFLKIYNNKNE
jgi:hypothetical protein